MIKISIKYLPFILAGKLYCSFKGVKYGKNLRTFGIPLVRQNKEAKIELGNNVVLTSMSRVNLAGINHQVILAAINPQSKIRIGNKSGMSGGVIIAAKSVVIGDYVNIGANVCIYDTDFHSLDRVRRRENLGADDTAKPITIEDDVWIGGNSIILKGVRIGRGAVVGAGSVVTKDIPEYSLWAGNPACIIRELKK